MVRNIFWSMAKSLGRETLRTGGKILSDKADNNDGMPAGDIVSRHSRDLIGKLEGRGLKCMARHASQRNIVRNVPPRNP